MDKKHNPMDEVVVSTSVQGKCITRNGETEIGEMTADVKNELVQLKFVSSKLHRSLNSGAIIRIKDMDEFCQKWIDKRKSQEVVDENKEAFDALSKAIELIDTAKKVLTEYKTKR